jgi:hypothetical protein
MVSPNSCFLFFCIFQKFSKIFRKFFGFGWGALLPRPPEFWLVKQRYQRVGLRLAGALPPSRLLDSAAPQVFGNSTLLAVHMLITFDA